jgi:hypothetical protein
VDFVHPEEGGAELLPVILAGTPWLLHHPKAEPSSAPHLFSSDVPLAEAKMSEIIAFHTIGE